jgi:hypothetical protein
MLRFACNEPGLVKWLQKKLRLAAMIVVMVTMLAMEVPARVMGAW